MRDSTGLLIFLWRAIIFNEWTREWVNWNKKGTLLLLLLLRVVGRCCCFWVGWGLSFSLMRNERSAQSLHISPRYFNPPITKTATTTLTTWTLLFMGSIILSSFFFPFIRWFKEEERKENESEFCVCLYNAAETLRRPSTVRAVAAVSRWVFICAQLIVYVRLLRIHYW